MQNNLENKQSQTKSEMLRYNVNALSNKLGLVGMICSICAAFLVLNAVKPQDWQTIFIILLNIVILLGGFLASEKVKNYSKKGAIAQVIFGVICAARIFYMPLQLVLNYADFLKNSDSPAKSWLGATITNPSANNILPSSGYFRGIGAMIFLAIAAAGFIASGIYGYIKAQQLEDYMASVNK